MKTTFNDFIQNSPKYKKYDGNPDAIYIYDNILSKDENIIAMIDISEAGKPALCACILEIENYHDSQTNPTFDLTDNFTKQTLGAMVKTVLEPFGYETKNQKDIPRGYNAKYVTSATTYAKTGPATMRVVRKTEEI